MVSLNAWRSNLNDGYGQYWDAYCTDRSAITAKVDAAKELRGE